MHALKDYSPFATRAVTRSTNVLILALTIDPFSSAHRSIRFSFNSTLTTVDLSGLSQLRSICGLPGHGLQCLLQVSNAVLTLVQEKLGDVAQDVHLVGAENVANGRTMRREDGLILFGLAAEGEHRRAKAEAENVTRSVWIRGKLRNCGTRRNKCPPTLLMKSPILVVGLLVAE